MTKTLRQALEDSSPYGIDLPTENEAGGFRFPSSDPAAQPWDVAGTWDVSDRGTVLIKSIRIELNPQSNPGAVGEGLTPDLIRTLTRVAPIKNEILTYVLARRPEIEQLARKDGGRSALIRRWDTITSDLGARPMGDGTSIADEQWAEWARDYLDEMRRQGEIRTGVPTTYGVDRALQEAWGYSIHTVRYRVAKMRHLGWLEGKRDKTRAGPLLTSHRQRLPS